MPVIKTFNHVVMEATRARDSHEMRLHERAGMADNWIETIGELDINCGHEKIGTARNIRQQEDGSVAATLTIRSRFEDHVFQLGFLFQGGMAVIALPPKYKAFVA